MVKPLMLVLFIFSYSIYPQHSIPLKSDVYADDGILKWKENNSEVCLFGVNYTAPFAYSFRALKTLNLSIKDAIDIDVCHMKRLGLDAFRIHVWDREVSDSSGNLINNEHLDLFDYLLKKLSDNGIKTILTPIAWWGTGWPEPDIITPGFSQKYSKIELITDPRARKAQRNYLKQFLAHVNPYSKLAYKDDPSIIAVEIINEPRHPADSDSVTEYINEMYDVLRGSGYSKPIFYNISENWNSVQAEAVSRSKVQGVSFQWYPTALVHNKMLEGNFLLNVNHYKIPSENVEGFNEKVKMVYEFDAADIGNSYMYPAMARSFREAGMQFAAMFSYDPAQIAWSNTEYPTHFLNLLYTPSKAISLMIAGKAFKNIPLYKSYGEYPANNRFNVFRVSYEEDLSEMNSETEFYYSNNTSTIPVSVSKLEHIAGCGNSPVVKYNGTGAYFLDKINEGTWILEIFPDVVWISDPFGKTSLKREAAKLFMNESELQIDIPSLKANYYCYSLKDNPDFQNANIRKLVIQPGIYIITNDEMSDEKIKTYSNKYHKAFSLFAPEKKEQYYVINNTSNEGSEKSTTFSFTIASENIIKDAVLYLRRPGWRGYEAHKLNKAGKYLYDVQVSSPALKSGLVEYCVTINTGVTQLTFPGYEQGNPNDWDFKINNLWQLKVNSDDAVLVLFDPIRDYKDLLYPHYSNSQKYFTDIRTNQNSGNFIYHCITESNAIPEKPFGFMHNVSKYIKQTSEVKNKYNSIVVRARYVNKKCSKIFLNLLFNDGLCLKSELLLDEKNNEIQIPLNTFKISERLILPDSYPLFLPKIWKGYLDNNPETFDLGKLEFIQFTIEKRKTNEIFTNEIEIEYIKLISSRPD